MNAPSLSWNTFGTSPKALLKYRFDTNGMDGQTRTNFTGKEGMKKKQTPSQDIHIFTLKCHVWQSLSCLFEL